jgi:Mrp family chromosome partitioning ATPase
MQAVRFEVDNELTGSKTLLINSITKAEGKTFLAINLAYAYASINKKVLLIDGNFSNPDITSSTQTKVYLEDFLKGSDDVSLLQANTRISLLGNKGHGRSLLEESDVQQIGLKLSALKSAFDVIIIEAPALETLNKSKEWTMFADKVITVFEAGKTINRTDREHITYLKSLNNKFSGWILNTVNRDELTNIEST